MRHALACIVLPCLFFSMSSSAQSGTIGSTPNPCTIEADESTCSTTVSWSSQGANSVCVWRVHPSLSPAKWSCTASHSGKAFSSIDESGRTFELRSNSSGSYSSSSLLDSVSVIGVQAPEPSGSITASPRPCTIEYGDSACSTTVSWSTQDANSVCVWRIHPSLSPAKWSCTASHNGNTFNGIDESGRTFELRANSAGSYSSSSLLDSVSVNGVQAPEPSGSIAASPNPCTIESGESTCSTTVSWSSQDAPSVCVWRIHPSLSPAKWTCTASHSGRTFADIDEDGRILELRADSGGSYSNSLLLDSQAVYGEAEAVGPPATFTGGSNLGWFFVESSGCDANDSSSRFDYDIVSTFHIDTYQDFGEWQGVPRDAITGRLQAMYNAGQRSFRLPIYHRHCGKLPLGTSEGQYGGNCASRFSGSASASDAGQLPPQAAQNVVDILSVAKSIGFERVIVSFLPTGSFNDPKHWSSFDSSATAENIGVIDDIVQRTETTSSALPVLIWDLRNEHIPAEGTSSEQVRIDYGAHLWNWWLGNYPSLQSVGFTVIASNTWHVINRFVNMPEIYGGIAPDAIAISLYSQCASNDYNSTSSSCEKESDILFEVDSILDQMAGFESIPLIISETYFNDTDAAAEIAASAPLLGRELRFMLQWPRERGAVGNCFQSSVAPYLYSDFGL